jgi:lysylphosphatidylglycerol synthetase-like protein (DUF2156 family)
MGKIRFVYVLFGISPRIWIGLRTYTEVPLYNNHTDITNLAAIIYVQVRHEAHGAFYWYQRPRHYSELRKFRWETTENFPLINVSAVIITLLRVCLIIITLIFHTLAWHVSNCCDPCRNNPQTFITTSQFSSKCHTSLGQPLAWSCKATAVARCGLVTTCHTFRNLCFV